MKQVENILHQTLDPVSAQLIIQAIKKAGTGVPAGMTGYFAAVTAPNGWFIADGALKSRTAYADLFAAIGTTFGVGDGTTTFQLPDLRAEFIRSFDSGKGIDIGRAFGSSQLDALQSHGHNITNSAVPTGLLIRDPGVGISSGSGYGGTDPETALKAESFYTTTGGTPRGDMETRPRNIALLACIKY